MPDNMKVQFNVPSDSRDTLAEVGRLLREDESFLRRLRDLVEEANRPDVVTAIKAILRRLDRFETRLDLITTDIAALNDGEFVGPDPSWTNGQGTGKRLTAEGEAELRRLVDRDMTDVEISKRIGVGQVVVSRKRKRYVFEQTNSSE